MVLSQLLLADVAVIVTCCEVVPMLLVTAQLTTLRPILVRDVFILTEISACIKCFIEPPVYFSLQRHG